MTEVNAPESVRTLEFLAPSNDAQLRYSRVQSPVGELLLLSDGEALSGLYLHAARYVPPLPADARHDDDALAEAAEQLAEYFTGRRRYFSLKVAPVGTPFQREVWEALVDIPFGTTSSYGEIADRVGRPSASRAVGAANGRNPISIVIPCHRVIGADGTLTGYAGGLDRKMSLLALERELEASA